MAGVLLAAIVLGVGLRLTLFSVSVNQIPGNGEEAMGYLLAEEIAGGARPLLFTAQPYQFPLDQYLMAPVVRYLPRNALGLRIVYFLVQLVSLAGLCLLAGRMFEKGERWPALLLLLFPSTYWLMQQGGYFIPQYTSFSVLSALLLLLTALSFRSPLRLLYLLAGGFIAGLAFSTHMLSLSIIVPCLLAMGLGSSLWDAVKGIPALGAGLLVGLTPYLRLFVLDPKAHEQVLESRSLVKGLEQFLQPGFQRTLAGVLGVNPSLFPDLGEHLEQADWLDPAILTFFTVLLGVLVFDRAVRFVIRLVRERWPRLELPDVFVGISLAALLLSGMSLRSSSGTYRYLLPVAWSMPFLVCYLYAKTPKAFRKLLAGIVLGLALFGAGTSAALVREWTKPDIAPRAANTPDISEVLHYLEKNDIGHCYASFWQAYRVVFETDREIICSPPYNERFYRWPLPYVDEVDEAEDAVYVLTNGYSARLTARRFEKDMRRMGIESDRETVGVFSVYSNFRQPAWEGTKVISREDFSLAASHSPERLGKARDGDTMTYWNSGLHQREGVWVEIHLTRPRPVTRVTLFHTGYPEDHAAAFRIKARDRQGEWKVVQDMVEGRPFDRVRLVNGHPVYSELSTTAVFSPVMTDSLRIELVKARNRNWSLSELEIAEVKAATPGAGTPTP
jgi:hypothetical protein